MRFTSLFNTKPASVSRVSRRVLAAALSVLLPALALLPGSCAQEVSALNDEAPYNSFSYDKNMNAVPMPHPFRPIRQISGQKMGIGSFTDVMRIDNLNDAQDLFVWNDEEIFIADSGNNRIVQLDSQLRTVAVIDSYEFEEESTGFSYPTGVFKDGQGLIYIADQKNGRVVILNEDHSTRAVYGKPVSELVEDSLIYQPVKVVADTFGRILVQAKGVYQGLMSLDEDGNFINYFGANQVKLTPRMIVQRVWKRILSDEQRAAMQAFIPVEYSNIYIDEENFVYATVAASSNVSQSLVKINPLGTVIREYSFPATLMTDSHRSPDDIITALDAQNGFLYLFSGGESSPSPKYRMFSFGGRGQQLGSFLKPTSLEYLGGNILVLDGTKNTLTLFEETLFGEKVLAAMDLYSEGLYAESLGPWQEVLSMDANYLLAYRGIGKAYFQMADYGQAMHHFRLADDREGYSDAFQKQSVRFMRANFGWFVLGIIVIYVGIKLIGRSRSRRRLQKKEGAYV